MSEPDEQSEKPCEPCRGTGKVISNLGDHSREVTCPWCQGGGVRIEGADAQQWRIEQDRSTGSSVRRQP